MTRLSGKVKADRFRGVEPSASKRLQMLPNASSTGRTNSRVLISAHSFDTIKQQRKQTSRFRIIIKTRSLFAQKLARIRPLLSSETQVTQWIFDAAIAAHFKMQMRSGGNSGAANQSDALSSTNGLTNFNVDS